MNGIIHWLGAELVYALGWTLLHSLWQGALVALVLAVVLAVTPQWSANARYRCSLVALGVVMLLGIWTFSRYYAVIGAALQTVAQSSAEDALTDSGSPVERLFFWINQNMPWIVLLWLTGFGVSLARYCGAFYYCHRLKTRLSVAAPRVLQARLKALSSTFGITRTVVLKLTGRVASPCVVGYLKPAILLPPSLMTQLSCDELEAILRHELAHIRRDDYLVGLVQSLIKALYFFNWPVLWISSQMDRERENACDDMAADGCKSRVFYAETLARASSLAPELSASNEGGLTMMVYGKRRYLMARIQRLFEGNKATAHPFEGMVTSLLLLVLGMFLSLSSQADDQYPDIETLDEVSVAQLIDAFKGQVTEAGDGHHIVTTLTPTADYRALSDSERNAFARYFKESLWRDVYQDMERVEHFSHLEEPEWLEVRRLWFEQSYGHFIDALNGQQSIAEQVEEPVGDHSTPVRFTRFESGRMEVEVPMAVIHDLEKGPHHKLEVGAFVLRHLGNDGVILVMRTGETMSDLAVKRRLVQADFGSDGALAGQMSYSSYNDDISSNRVSSFVATDRFYQVWLDKRTLANLEQGDNAPFVDALSGYRMSQDGVLEVAFHPSRSRYTSSRLMNYMGSVDAPYAANVERKLEAKLKMLPSDLHSYLYDKEHVERHFLAWSLREGVAIGERQRDYFSNLFRKTRVEFLLEAAQNPERDALALAHNSIEMWPKDSIWVNVYPMTKDKPVRVFDLMVKEKPFPEAVAQVTAQCGDAMAEVRYKAVDQEVSLYGFETHCEQLKRVLDQMAERYGAVATL